MIDNSTFFVILFLGFMLMSEDIRNKIISVITKNKKMFFLLVIGIILLIK